MFREFVILQFREVGTPVRKIDCSKDDHVAKLTVKESVHEEERREYDQGLRMESTKDIRHDKPILGYINVPPIGAAWRATNTVECDGTLDSAVNALHGDFC